MSTRRIQAPSIVLDWNLILKMPRDKDVPPHFQCIVPAQAWHEVATATADNAEIAVKKFTRWGTKNIDRIWMGRWPEDLFYRQQKGNRWRLRMRDIVEPSRSFRWRRALRDQNTDWQKIWQMIKDSDMVKRRLHQIDQSVKLSEAIVALWETNPNKRPPRQDEMSAWVRQSQRVTDLIEKFAPRYWRKEWRKSLDLDRNRIAIIRWGRFFAWYCAKLAAGGSHRFENNYDDIHYGLLSSYSGFLGTSDVGLIEATRGIFPKVNILGLEGLVQQT
jgi:hypothetical protein